MTPVPVVLQTTAVCVKPQVTKKPRVIMIEANSPWVDGGMEIAGGERNAVEHYA